VKVRDKVCHKRTGRTGEVRELSDDGTFAIVYWDGGFAVSATDLDLLKKL